MNCKDYKEAIAADPSMSFDGASHADACESCAIFRDEILELDQKIASALEIAVPTLKLPELVPVDADEDDGKVVNLPVRNHRFRHWTAPAWVGLAASLVVATVLGVRMLSTDIVYPSLAAEIVAHLDHEPKSLRITDKPVSERQLAKVVRDDIAEMDDDVGLITYARTCVINGNKIPHLVMQGKRGPITLLLLPDEMLDAAVSLDGEGITGVILPLGQGSIAIIGDRDEPLDDVRQRVADSVKWSI